MHKFWVRHFLYFPILVRKNRPIVRKYKLELKLELKYLVLEGCSSNFASTFTKHSTVEEMKIKFMTKQVRFIVMVISLLFTSTVDAVVSAYDYTMTIMSASPDNEEDDFSTRKKDHGMRVYCEITQEGIILSSMNSEDISFFEVCDEHGSCIAAFGEEQDFLEYIFSGAISGCVEIRFHINGKILYGLIDLD